MPASEDQAWRVADLTTRSEDQLADLLSGDPRDAAPWVRACAAMGIPEAQTRLGRMLLAGEGVEVDQVEAFQQFEAASHNDDAHALNMLGRCYAMGWGVAVDKVRAAACFKRAADAGDAWGQYNFGHALLDGEGVARDGEAAFTSYKRAADQGHARAMNLVGRCLEQGWGVTRNAVEAARWYRRSADGGYYRGCFNYASVLAQTGAKAWAKAWLMRARDLAPHSVALPDLD